MPCFNVEELQGTSGSVYCDETTAGCVLVYIFHYWSILLPNVPCNLGHFITYPISLSVSPHEIFPLGLLNYFRTCYNFFRCKVVAEPVTRYIFFYNIIETVSSYAITTSVCPDEISPVCSPAIFYAV